MVITFTDDVDCSGRGKRLSSYQLNANAATVVRFREGSIAGAVKWEVAFPAAGQAGLAFTEPLFFFNLFIECTVAITSGFVDLN